jgi:hypothetical protein
LISDANLAYPNITYPNVEASVDIGSQIRVKKKNTRNKLKLGEKPKEIKKNKV